MSKVIADTATAVSASVGLWGWINENAGAISVVISIVSLSIGLTFYILNYIENRKRTAKYLADNKR